MARTPVNMNLGGTEAVRVQSTAQGISAPVARAAPSPLLQLADSLASIRPEIGSILQGYQEERQKKDEERAYDTIQGMTYEQAQSAVQSGAMRETESPFYRAAFQKQFGLSHAAKRKRQLISDYNNTFDKNGGDLDSFLAGYAQEDYEQFGDSEFIRSGIREGMAGVFDQVRNAQAEYLDTRLQTQAGDQFYEVAGAAVDSAIANGGDVGAALGGLYKDHESALGMAPEALDKVSYALAQRYAVEGNVDALNALLSADPTGQGSFLTRPAYATDSKALLETARANLGKTDRAANANAMVDLKTRAQGGMLDERDIQQIDTFVGAESLSAAEREALLVQNETARETRRGGAYEEAITADAMSKATEAVTNGRGNFLVDEKAVNPYTGKEIALKADDLVQQVVDEQLTAMADRGPAVMATQLASYGVAATYKPWENSLSNGYIALGSALMKAGDKGELVIPEPAASAYQLWKGMVNEPRLRDRHVKDATAAAVYRDAEVLERTGGFTAEEALRAAAGIDRKSSRSNLATQIERDAFRGAVNQAVSQGWFTDDPINAGFAAGAIEDHARILMDLGLDQGRAIKEAKDAFDDSHSVVMGVLYNNRDVYVPPDFDKIATSTVANFAQTHGLDADDLHLVPDGRNQGYWNIVDDMMQPVDHATPIHITRLQTNPNGYSMDDANAEIRDSAAPQEEGYRWSLDR